MASRQAPVVGVMAILFAVLVIGIAGVPGGRKTKPVVASLSTADWYAIASELEDRVPARALLGGIEHPELSMALDRRQLSWAAFRDRASKLMRETSPLRFEPTSGAITTDMAGQFGADLDIEIDGPDHELEEQDLPDEIDALVQRLQRRLPNES